MLGVVGNGVYTLIVNDRSYHVDSALVPTGGCANGTRAATIASVVRRPQARLCSSCARRATSPDVFSFPFRRQLSSAAAIEALRLVRTVREHAAEGREAASLARGTALRATVREHAQLLESLLWSAFLLLWSANKILNLCVVK